MCIEETTMTIYCRGIRGATTVDANTREAILEATRDMLARAIEANDLRVEDIASAIFSTTQDLNAEFPAVAARELGWLDTPLFCTHEMAVPGSLERCIRVLIHWNTSRRADEIVHVYIRGATSLRPELAVMPRRIVDPFEVITSTEIGE
jgi:chorismate mutase